MSKPFVWIKPWSWAALTRRLVGLPLVDTYIHSTTGGYYVEINKVRLGGPEHRFRYMKDAKSAAEEEIKVQAARLCRRITEKTK